jgi:hypothetical protein
MEHDQIFSLGVNGFIINTSAIKRALAKCFPHWWLIINGCVPTGHGAMGAIGQPD